MLLREVEELIHLLGKFEKNQLTGHTQLQALPPGRYLPSRSVLFALPQFSEGRKPALSSTTWEEVRKSSI